jgi:hypothetical protein
MLGEWQSLIGTVEANLDEIPQLEPFVEKLSSIAEEVLEVNQRQGALRASKQEASKRKRKLALEGQRLATLMRQALKEHFGPRAEKLAEFGLQPFRSRFGDSEEEPEAPAPEPTDPTPPVE